MIGLRYQHRDLQECPGCVYIRGENALRSASEQGLCLNIANCTPCMGNLAVARFSWAHWLGRTCVDPVYCPGIVIIPVWAAYRLRTHYACSALLAVCTVQLPCTYCLWCACQSNSDLFKAFSKFDGACSACLAHLSDSPAHIWQSHSMHEDPGPHVAYLTCICYFSIPCDQLLAMHIASPATGHEEKLWFDWHNYYHINQDCCG